MAINFPNSPSDGDSVIINGVEYSYDSTKLIWKTTDATGTILSLSLSNTSNTANAAFAAANTKTVAADLTTANVIELTNLYFTNTRAISAFTAGSGMSIASNGRLTVSVVGGVTSVAGRTGDITLTTSDVSEGSNLFFTNTRSVSALTAGSGMSIASNGRLTVTVTGGGGGVDTVGGSTGNISNAQLATFISQETVPNLTVSGNVLLSNVIFRTPDTSNTISISILNGSSINFQGNAGQLFSITDNLIGTIFSVNDISGIPSIEVNSDGRVILSEYTGNVLIGKSTDATGKLQVNGDIYGNVFYGNGAGLTGLTAGVTTGKAIAMAIVFG